jgi:hypothetical protein
MCHFGDIIMYCNVGYVSLSVLLKQINTPRILIKKLVLYRCMQNITFWYLCFSSSRITVHATVQNNHEPLPASHTFHV